MSSGQNFYVVLLPSVSHVMKAEKILIAEHIACKIIPVPKSISSDCGVCIRLEENMVEKTGKILQNSFENIDIRLL